MSAFQCSPAYPLSCIPNLACLLATLASLVSVETDSPRIIRDKLKAKACNFCEKSYNQKVLGSVFPKVKLS